MPVLQSCTAWHFPPKDCLGGLAHPTLTAVKSQYEQMWFYCTRTGYTFVRGDMLPSLCSGCQQTLAKKARSCHLGMPDDEHRRRICAAVQAVQTKHSLIRSICAALSRPSALGWAPRSVRCALAPGQIRGLQQLQGGCLGLNPLWVFVSFQQPAQTPSLCHVWNLPSSCRAASHAITCVYPWSCACKACAEASPGSFVAYKPGKAAGLLSS